MLLIGVLSFLLIAAFWIGTTVNVAKRKREGKWRVGLASPVAPDLPPLTVVIPARNEAHNIADCVRAVRASDHPNLRIRVFDDGSTDGTGELAAAAGAEVQSGDNGPVPEGWKGKPWALQRATRDLDTPYLLFLDADVRVEPGALSRAHTWAIQNEAALLSGLGRLQNVSFWERVIQPSVAGLILAGNKLDEINQDDSERTMANGQFILVRRDAYEALGGHAMVADNILDDVGMAKAFRKAGYKTRVVLMLELFRCRMYQNFGEIWRGWTKNLFAGMNFQISIVIGVTIFLSLYAILPYVMLVVGLLTSQWGMAAWGGGLVAVILTSRFFIDRLYGEDVRFGIFQLVGVLILIALIWNSALRSRTAVEWKGRSYVLH